MSKRGGGLRFTEEQLEALTGRPAVLTAPGHKTAQAKRKARKPAAPNETQECRTFMGWCELVMFAGEPLALRVAHMPNERESWIQRAILSGIGVKAGYPDYVIDAPYGQWHGLRIEAKRAHGGKRHDDQVNYCQRLMSWGYYAEICEGHQAMVAAVCHYMDINGATGAGVFVNNARFWS